MTPSVVLLSGGQDSTTCLAWAMHNLGTKHVHAVSFDYRQRHYVELEQARYIASLFGVEKHHVLTVEALSQLGGAALTDPSVEVEAQASAESLNSHAFARGLPSTFVPGRNMLFFTLAAALGAKYGIYDLVTGVCQQDRAGYPDCRAEFVNAAQGALTLALDETVTIHAPLLELDKKGTWELAAYLGILDTIIHDTHTCYNGVRDELYAWGYGCGTCPACLERRRGYKEAFGGRAPVS